MKTLQERNDIDLFQLTLELHGRALLFPENKQMHDNSIEANTEMQNRLQKSTNVCQCEKNDYCKECGLSR